MKNLPFIQMYKWDSHYLRVWSVLWFELSSVLTYPWFWVTNDFELQVILNNPKNYVKQKKSCNARVKLTFYQIMVNTNFRVFLQKYAKKLLNYLLKQHKTLTSYFKAYQKWLTSFFYTFWYLKLSCLWKPFLHWQVCWPLEPVQTFISVHMQSGNDLLCLLFSHLLFNY